MSAFGGIADMTFGGSPLSRSLLGAKRTWVVAPQMSASDPKRTCTKFRVGPPANSILRSIFSKIRSHVKSLEEYGHAKSCPFLRRCGDHVAPLCRNPNFCRPFQLCSSAKQGGRACLRQRTNETVQRRANGRAIWRASASNQRATVLTKEPSRTPSKMPRIGEQCYAPV